MICLSIVFAALAAVSSTANADILKEDYCYWLADGRCVFTDAPDRELELLAIIWVQQTIYDDIESKTTLLELDRTYEMPVYLYAYTVTNQNWWAGQGTGGITSFGVDWGSAVMVEALVDPDTAGDLGWKAIRLSRPGIPADGPGWVFQRYPPDEGILVGASVGGFWAVALTGVDRIVDAAAVSGDPDLPLGERLKACGKTTGPVPEPAGILALMVGLVGTCCRLFKR